MKLLTGLFLFLAISSAFAMPAGNPDDDAEYVPVSRRQQGVPRDYDSDVGPDFKDFKGVVDTGAGYPFFSLRPYNTENTGFFDGFEGLLKRLRESVLNRWWSSIPQPSDFDPSEGNTTSVVKVIDGHRVEINDTVYTKTDDFGNSIYKVRVVNIRPFESSEDPTTDGPGEEDKGSREELERGPQDNEVLGNIDSTEVKPSASPK